MFVVAAVNLGHTLPVTELPQDHDSLSLKGKPVVPGYESHYTVVPKKKAIGDAFPLSGNQSVEPARHADELVFQNASIATLHHLHLIVATMFVTFSNSYHHKFHFHFRFLFFLSFLILDHLFFLFFFWGKRVGQVDSLFVSFLFFSFVFLSLLLLVCELSKYSACVSQAVRITRDQKLEGLLSR